MKTNSLSGQTWLAAYLYYNEPWEEFLQQAIMPFVRQILLEGLAQQFFFIRYWEKGPHIRLRFKGEADVLENKVKPALLQYFSHYFAQHPSCRTDPAWLAEVPEAYQWFPNNSIQFISYEPETERYGGDTGILISEQQFQVSSEAVLAVIAASKHWDYNQALGVAIQMHLGFAFTAGMNLSEIVEFFSCVFQNWLPRAYEPYQQNLTTTNLKARQDDVLKAFRHTYEKQKSTLLVLFTQIWQALENQTKFEQAWFNNWVGQMRTVNEDLRQAQANGQLILPDWTANLPTETTTREKQQRWYIYDSYIHMTNNRLGIRNRDEGYLAYLIKEGLTEMVLSTV